jgi:hypothetical protein
MREIVHKVKNRVAILLASLEKMRTFGMLVTVGDLEFRSEKVWEPLIEVKISISTHTAHFFDDRVKMFGCMREGERERKKERAEYANGCYGRLRRYTQEQKTK